MRTVVVLLVLGVALTIARPAAAAIAVDDVVELGEIDPVIAPAAVAAPARPRALTVPALPAYAPASAPVLPPPVPPPER